MAGRITIVVVFLLAEAPNFYGHLFMNLLFGEWSRVRHEYSIYEYCTHAHCMVYPSAERQLGQINDPILRHR